MKNIPKFCVHCGSPIKPGEKFCMKCGAQLVKNLFDKTVIEPTKIEPTEVKPAEIEPTEIKPTKIEPTEIKPTEIKPTEIKPTEIEPTPIEPTPIKPGVWGRLVFFVTHPNVMIFGILGFAFSLATAISVGVGGFQWWNIFLLLPALFSIFEVVFAFIKAPYKKVNSDGSQRSKGYMVGDKFEAMAKIPAGTKPTFKHVVGPLSGAAGTLTLTIFLLISLFSGFQNFVVLDGYVFRYSSESYGYDPEVDYELVEFYPGFKAVSKTYRKGELKFQASGSYWRSGRDCGIRCFTLDVGDWYFWGTNEELGYTINFVINNYRELQSLGAFFYRTDTL